MELILFVLDASLLAVVAAVVSWLIREVLQHAMQAREPGPS